MSLPHFTTQTLCVVFGSDALVIVGTLPWTPRIGLEVGRFDHRGIGLSLGIVLRFSRQMRIADRCA